MKNNDLRAEMVRRGLFVYQVADAMGIKANTLSHYLMTDLSKPRIARIKAAISKAEKDLKHGKTKKESV